IEYCIVDIETFKTNNSPIKLNYSSHNLKNCISIQPHSLLFETSIKQQEINIHWIHKIPYFFKTSETRYFNYDILASTFFVVSRYEEYLPTDLDVHKRFKAENSIAFKNNFLEIPIVNLWALELKKEILKNELNFYFPKLKYNFINSIDIDIAYAYKGKGKVRLIGSSLKAVFTFNFKELKNRINFFTKRNKDPYDSYNFIHRLQKQYKTKNIYFFQLGDYGKFDKNLSHKSKELKKLIKTLVKKNTIGIHPSYASNYNKDKISIEIERLQKISNKKISNSRQHYLILKFPHTYEQLINCNIEHDYTMGYATQIGFRAGICTTYPFFNIIKNEERKLLITPFQIMDGSLNQYLNLSPIKAIEKITKLVDITKKNNGTFVSIWHNSTLSECYEWKQWSKVYEKLIKIAKDS
ncbi:polysaccharide deacetylase family protein, partial [uncultured Lutibacter sp.]|uniref:polysaccharide deacetylase family protein n=1 Tax=uncultured Lutibacter sp. TaxID=437739 RepID=UPI0026394BA6